MFSLKTMFSRHNNPQTRMLAIVLSIVMLTMILTGAMYDSRRKKITVSVIDAFNGIVTTDSAITREAKVGDALDELAYNIGEYDELNCEFDAPVKNNANIVIRRGKPLTIICDGEEKVVGVVDKVVRDALEAEGIELGSEDFSVPDLLEEIDFSQPLRVVRVTREDWTQTIDRPFEEIVVNDDSMYEDEKETRQAGVNGVVEVTYSGIYHDGVFVGCETVAENMLVEPVNQIVAVGTKKRVNTHPDGFTYKKMITVSATAYDPYPAGGSGTGRTANGMKAQKGVVAVDPKVIPLGTKLYIESTDGTSWSYGYCIAADTGGAIKGNKIDLCYNTVAECIQFGRRKANVYILN